MAFSKGKRIEDETSRRIVELAVNIGCKEGADVLTVTRLCRELNCDRRVIYNRFRDIDEINLIVARRCNEILLEIMQMIEDGKTAGDVRAETDSYKAAESIWIITTGIGGMLAANGNYRFQDGLNTMLYGVEAIVSYMSAEMEDENGNRKTWKHRNHCQ